MFYKINSKHNKAMTRFEKMRIKQKANEKRINQLLKSVDKLTKSHKRRYNLDSDDSDQQDNNNNDNMQDGNARKRRKLNRIHRSRHHSNNNDNSNSYDRSHRNGGSNNNNNNNNDPNENKQDNINDNQGNQNQNIYNNNDNNSASFDRLGLGLEKDAITEVYRFKSTYDGTLGEPALLFRQAVIDYEDRVEFRLGDRYDEERLVGRIHDALSDKAKQKLRTDEARRQYTVTEFLKWFDKAFKLYKLRKQLYHQLTNWTIGPNDSELQLVDDYQAKYNLFKETTSISTPATIASTKLPREMRINCLNRAIELAKPNLHKQITHWIQNQHRQPKSLDELNTIIEDSISTLEAIAANSNNRNKDPTDLGTEHKSHLTSNNDSQSNDQSSNVLNTTTYDSYNQSNYNSNRYNIRSRGRGRGRGGYRGRYRGGYRGRGRGRRGGSRGGYRGRGYRGRGRGYRGSRRGSRGGRYYDRSNDDNKDKSIEKNVEQSDDEIPMYKRGDCYNCNEWGHIADDCDRIHTRKYDKLRQQYISFKSSKGSVNNVKQSKDKTKSKSKSYNTNYSDSEYDEERDY